MNIKLINYDFSIYLVENVKNCQLVINFKKCSKFRKSTLICDTFFKYSPKFTHPKVHKKSLRKMVKNEKFLC